MLIQQKASLLKEHPWILLYSRGKPGNTTLNRGLFFPACLLLFFLTSFFFVYLTAFEWTVWHVQRSFPAWTFRWCPVCWTADILIVPSFHAVQSDLCLLFESVLLPSCNAIRGTVGLNNGVRSEHQTTLNVKRLKFKERSAFSVKWWSTSHFFGLYLACGL